MRNAALAFILFPGFALLGGCAEIASSGDSVSIPSIRIDCTTAACRALRTPTIIGIITNSGCVSPDFGATRSMSTTSITCTVGTGCTGYLSGWITSSGNSSSTLPSGTYSICVIVDYNHSYTGFGAAVSGDTGGALNNVLFGDTTGTQFVVSFTDVP